MSAKRILLLVFGSLIALIGLGLTAAGVIGLVAYGTSRDSDGFFATSTERFATPRYALASDDVDLDAEGDAAGPVSLGDLARVRVRAESLSGQPAFVGIGPREAVEQYLDGVAYDEVTDVDFDPFDVSYRAHPGTTTPAPPIRETFWVAQAVGSGRQSLEWDLESGEWTLVVMNADGSPNVVTELQLGVKIKILLGLSIGLLVGGLVILALGILMIVFGARGGRGDGRGPPGAAPAPTPAEAGPTTTPRHESPY